MYKCPEVTRLELGPLNNLLTCKLCFGYLIDATTLVECQEPHSFCRSCVLKHLEQWSKCPMCETEVNLSLPTEKLVRPDRTLQDLVYKLVPGLYKKELKRRRDFYAAVSGGKSLDKPETGKIFDSHLVELASFICTAEELISLSLEYAVSVQSSALDSGSHKPTGNGLQTLDLKFKRYFRCPAAVTIHHLKKLLIYKLELPPKYSIDISYANESLDDSYSLMDIAYIYSWRRKAPMQLFFHIWKPEKEDENDPMPLLLAQASPPLVRNVEPMSSVKQEPEPLVKVVGTPKNGEATISLPSLTPVLTIDSEKRKAEAEAPTRKKRKPSVPQKKLKTTPPIATPSPTPSLNLLSPSTQLPFPKPQIRPQDKSTPPKPKEDSVKPSILTSLLQNGRTGGGMVGQKPSSSSLPPTQSASPLLSPKLNEGRSGSLDSAKPSSNGASPRLPNPPTSMRPHIIPAFLAPGSDSAGPRVPGVLVFNNDPRNLINPSRRLL